MNDKITYADFIDEVALKGEVSQDLVQHLLAATIHLVENSLHETGHAVIQGVGRFQLQWHETREGRNPQTGETIQISAHSSVRFKPDANLRKFINRKYAHLKPKFLKEKQQSIINDTTVVEEEYNIPTTVGEVELRDRFSSQREKSSWRWWWAIIPLLIIALAFLLWPNSQSNLSDTQELPLAKSVVENAPEEVPDKIAVEAPAEKVKSHINLESTGTPGSVYEIQAGNNLWGIANDYYGSSYLWPLIYQANLEKMNTPDQVIPGTHITVPSLEGDKFHLTQTDKMTLSKGFIHAYLYYKDSQPVQAREYLWVVQKWGMNDLFEEYRDQINTDDLNQIQAIAGKVTI